MRSYALVCICNNQVGGQIIITSRRKESAFIVKGKTVYVFISVKDNLNHQNWIKSMQRFLPNSNRKVAKKIVMSQNKDHKTMETLLSVNYLF